MSMIKSVRQSGFPALWIIAGIPVICITGTLLHFAYNWSGQSVLVGIFAPVNESIWEHQKLIFWPSLFYWSAGFLLQRGNAASAGRWICACSGSLYFGPLFIIAFYYTYTGAFGIHSLILDILSFYLGVTIAQLFGLHVYRYTKPEICCILFAALAIVLLAAAFVFFTFAPPHIPLFMDPITGTYGI